MATASHVSLNFQTEGSPVTVPLDDVARLIYYLQCVTVSLGLDIVPRDLTDYQHYRQLTLARRDLVFQYAFELYPDVLIDKIIFLDDEREVIPSGYDNQFCTISAAVSLVSVEQNLFLAGKAQSATQVLFCTTRWLQRNFWEPAKNSEFAIARAIGSLHCSHCDGSNGLCSCTNGCPRRADAECEESSSSTVGVQQITGFFEALRIASPPNIRDTQAETHNGIICDGCTGSSKGYISGGRFKCRLCNDYDLCETCYTSNVHDLSHNFWLIMSPRSARPLALAKRNEHWAYCDGCSRTVQGTLYLCKTCDDFDFCEECYATKPHDPSHRFSAIEYPDAEPIPLPARVLVRPPTPPIPTPAPSTSDNKGNSNHTPQAPSVSDVPPNIPNPSPSAVSQSTDQLPLYDKSTPFFYHDLDIPDLTKYLQERDVAYSDDLGRESLTRLVWDTHVDCMSFSELNTFLREQEISTVDCVDVNSRRQKAKDAFQVSRPVIVQADDTTSGQFKVDDIIILSGLKKAEMNGKTGKVISIDIEAGRVEVQIEDMGKSFKVKFENVALATTTDDSELLD